MDNEEIPESFRCKISFDLMKDPVILGTTGHTFDRQNIEAWFMTHNTNPLTNLELSPENQILIPNISLREAIEECVIRLSGRIITYKVVRAPLIIQIT